MRPNEVEEENKDRNSGVCGIEGTESALGFVPCLKAVIERFNEVVADVVLEALDANVPDVLKVTLDRHLVSGIAIADNRLRSTHMRDMRKQRMSLRRGAMRREVKTEHKAGFTVDNEPNVMLLTVYLHYGFIGMPLVRVEVHHRHELHRYAVKDGSELLAPVGDRNMRQLNAVELIEHEGNVPCRAFAYKELVENSNDKKWRMTHSFEICLAEQLGYGRR